MTPKAIPVVVPLPVAQPLTVNVTVNAGGAASTWKETSPLATAVDGAVKVVSALAKVAQATRRATPVARPMAPVAEPGIKSKAPETWPLGGFEPEMMPTDCPPPMGWGDFYSAGYGDEPFAGGGMDHWGDGYDAGYGYGGYDGGWQPMG